MLIATRSEMPARTMFRTAVRRRSWKSKSAGVKALLMALIDAKRPGDFVFTREGKAVRDFRGAWEAATTAAGVPEFFP